MFEEKSLRTLEYEKILSDLAVFAQSSGGKALALKLLPLEDLESVVRALDETSEADKVLFEYAVSPSFAVDECSQIIIKASKGSVLSIAELLKVARTLRVARRLIKTFSALKDVPILSEMARDLYENELLERGIFDSFISETEVADGASEELRSIRARIRKINDNVRTKLQLFITSPEYSKYLQDNIVTVRGDRYVIPVKSDFKGSIAGLVHDQSASGSTLYVEPMQVVELNNDLKVELAKEQAEIERILRAFSSRVSASGKEIALSYETVVRLDFIFAKAQLAREYKAVRPDVNSTRTLSIVEGRHPLIDRAKVVPITLGLKEEEKLLLITGPNTGGKTVTLKLVGLFVALAMSGLYLPAKSCNIPIVDGVFCDIGDEQSIEQSLSTFSGHIKNSIEILDKITPRSLVLFDELGAGTDPSEGAALAVSITEYLINENTKAIITSHFNDLKEFALVTEGVVAASMEFDVNTFSPTFRLVMGAIGSSNALAIAKKLGLKEEVVNNARSRLSHEKRQFDSVLSAAERTRQKAERLVSEAAGDREQAAIELKEAEKQRKIVEQKREKLDESIRRQTKELIEDSVDEADELIEKIKEILSKPESEITEADLFEARKHKRQLENMSAEYSKEAIVEDEPDDSPLKAGDAVYIKSLSQRGILLSVSARGEALIAVGNLKLKIKKGDYYKIKKR